jgi:hypothetical protein
MPDITGALTRSTLDVLQLRGEYMVVGAETIYVYDRDHNANILRCAGTTVPTAATSGYAKGCLFIKTDAADGTQGLYQNKGLSTSCSFELIQPGGGGGGGSLDDAYDTGSTITMDAGPITLNDATAGTSNDIVIVKTGAGSGNLIDLSVDAALTGAAIAIDMNLGIAAPGITLDNGGTARTGADFAVTADSTGAHSVIDINASGSGACIGFDYQNSYNGSPAGYGVSLTLDANDAIDTTAMLVSRGAGLRTVPAIDINDGSTGNADLVDIDLTGIFTADVLSIAFGAAATGNAIFVNLDNAVAATGLHLEGSGVRTQPMVEIITDSTSSASLIDISVDGAITGTAAVDIDMNAGLAANAIYIDAGGGTRTADEIAVKHDGDGNVDVMSIVATNTGTGAIFDINMDGAGSTGGVFNIDMNAAVGATVMTIDAGAGTRTVDMIDVTFDGDGNVGFLDLNVTNTGSGNLIDIDVDAIHTGNVFDVTYGTAAATGDAIKVTMGTNLAGSALVLVGTGNRSDDLIKIDTNDTGSGQIFDINITGASSANVLDITYTAANTGDAISLALGTAVGASALVITGTGIRTEDIIQIDTDDTGAAHDFDINITGIGSGNCIDITYSAADTGDALAITMADNVAGSAIALSAAGARTDDLIKIDSSATGAGLVFDINLTGAASGNVFDVTYSVGANTGNAISLAMGTNVGGQALVITSAATGVAAEGSALDIAHTGDLVANADLVRIVSTGNHDATSNVVYLEQSTGAGAAGTTLLRLNATGANVEAIAVDAGLTFLSTATATPGAGDDETLPTATNVVAYDPNGASRAGVILTAGLRDGQTVSVVNIADAAETITFAAAGVSNVAGGASVSIARYECVTFVWNAATSLWYCMGAGL